MEQREEFFETLFRTVPIGVMGIDQAGCIVLANPALESLFGYRSGELVGQPLTDVLPDSIPGGDLAEAKNDPAAPHEKSGFQQRAARHHDGRFFAVSCQATAAEWHGEQVTVVFVTASAAQQSEANARDGMLMREHAALHAAEQRARAAAEASQQKIEALAQASKTFSEAALDLPVLLDKVVQLIAETIGDSCILHLLTANGHSAMLCAAYHVDPHACAVLRDTVDAAFRTDGQFVSRVVQTGAPILIPHVTTASIPEPLNPYLQSYIEQFGLHSMIIVPLRIEDQVIGVLAVSREETPGVYTDDDMGFVQALADRAALAIRNAQLYDDARESSQRAHEALDLLDTFFQDASVGFALVDHAFRFQRVNDRLAEINGVSAAAHVGRTIREIIPDVAAQIESALQRVLTTGEPQLNIELRGTTLSHPDHIGYWLDNYYPIRRSDGSVQGIGVVVSDITAQKHAEARQAMQFHVTRILAEASTPDEAMPKLLEAVCNGDGWDLGAFWCVEDAENVLRLDSYWHTSTFMQATESAKRKIIFRLGISIATRVWMYDAPVWYEHATWNARAAQRPKPMQPHFQSAFAVPVRTDTAVIGMMVFFSYKQRARADELLRIGVDLGSQIGQFFMHRQAERRLMQHTKRIKALHSISHAILALQSPREIAHAALSHLHNLIVCSTLHVAIFHFADHTVETWRLNADSPDPLPRAYYYPIEDFPNVDALRRREAFAVHDLRDVLNPSGLQQTLRDSGILSYIGVPICSQEALIGAMYLAAEWPHAFSPEAVAITHEVADLLAIALQNTQLFEQVRTGRERLQALSDRLVQAQEEERRYLARELHDEVGQTLTALHMNLQLLAVASDQPTHDTCLEDSTVLVETVLNQVRAMSLELRPSILDDLGLVPALRWLLARQAERMGCAIQFDSGSADIRYDRRIETTCFRVVQEALNNIARYAHAQRVQVTLVHLEGALQCTVQDNGVGFNVAAARERATLGESLGLLSMQERVELVGGKFAIQSENGQGTVIHVWLPLAGAQSGLEVERRRWPR
jgi:PAS domain S-box-containing protein